MIHIGYIFKKKKSNVLLALINTENLWTVHSVNQTNPFFMSWINLNFKFKLSQTFKTIKARQKL